MLRPHQKRPNISEARRETKKRLAIVKLLLPKLKPFSDAVLIVGSLAFAKDHAIHSTSDVDLLILMDPERAGRIIKTGIFENSDWVRFAVETFKKGKVHHMTLSRTIRGIRVEFHFWDKKAEFRASALEIKTIRRLSGKSKISSTFHQDFFGRIIIEKRKSKKYGKGFLQHYKVYDIVHGRFVPHEPLINLIMFPDTIFLKDKKLWKNINVLWRKLAQRLSQEYPGIINLSKASIVRAMPGNWNLTNSLRKSLEKRTEKELSKLGARWKY